MSKARRKRRNLFSDSVESILMTYDQYVNLFREIAISSIKWINMPETIDKRFLEFGLFRKGFMLYFKDEAMGDLCLRATLGGNLDVYDIPIERTAYASNGYQNNLQRSNSVVIWDNLSHWTNNNPLLIYAKRLSEIDRTIDINVKAQKTPILIRATEEQRLSMLNAYEDYDGGKPVIFADKGFMQGDENTMKAYTTLAPFVANDLYQLKVNIWNEALTYLGITNISVQKKERMIKDEVNRLQGGVLANRNSRIFARQQACEEINKMFGTEIWCEFADLSFDNSERGESDNE